MKLKLSRPLVAAFAALALAGVGTAAQARDNVYWSLGINAAPGVAVGVGNYAPVYPQPVYVAPQPVYVAPPPVYVSRPAVVVAPAPVWYYGYGHRGHHRGWEHRHGRHWR